MIPRGSRWAVTHGEFGHAHVHPLCDSREHDLSDRCWCHPWLDEGIRVHTSNDKRELRERDYKPPNRNIQ